MKHIGFFFLVLWVFSGCVSRDIKGQLNLAECCMQAHPDSALAIIRSIDTTSLGSGALKARYALLHAMALDKSWIDTTDIGVVMPAVTWYDRHKPLSARAKPWYYLGRIQYNGHHYDEAIISFTHAREYAEDLDDDRFKALVFQAIADTYNICHLYEEALNHAEQAYLYDLLAKDTLLANGTLFSIALLNNNLKNYSKADTLLNQLLSSDNLDSRLLPSVLTCYAQLAATYEKDYEKAVSLFEKELSLNQGMDSYNSWAAYAYSLYQIGERKKSALIFNDLEQAGLKDQFVYQFWKSRIEQLEGNYQRAFSLLDGAIQDQTEGVLKLLRQSTVKAQRDYLSLQNSSLKEENHLRRWINILLAVAIIASVLVFVFIIKQYRENVYRKNQELMSAAQEIVEQREFYEHTFERLSSKLRETTERQARIRQEFFHLKQDNFKELSDLCNTYYKTEGKSSQANSVCGEVRGLLQGLGVADDKYPAFEKRVNETFDKIMVHFRAEHPDHREQYFQTVCYLFAGFKTRTIALLLHREEQDVYQTRWRLKKEIESEQTPHQNDFKSLLDSPIKSS